MSDHSQLAGYKRSNWVGAIVKIANLLSELECETAFLRIILINIENKDSDALRQVRSKLLLEIIRR